MMRLKTDFTNSQRQPSDRWYDLREDWALVESSIASQYGIRLRHERDMPWPEFTTLVSGLLPETPLGAIIKIRSETDPEIIKGFNSDQRKIYNQWRERRAMAQLDNPEVLEQSMLELNKMIESMFG